MMALIRGILNNSDGNKYIHLSVDDVIGVFKELTITKPDSIFDTELFHYLRKLHRRYGAVVSCYCFYNKKEFSLAQCTREYKEEFEENASWLRFGFHGYSGSEDYISQSIDDSYSQYQEVIINLKKIVGINALDKFPRIHTFRASDDFVRLLADNDILCISGLLAADDERLSYSLNSDEDKILKEIGYIEKHNILYMRSSQRFDSIAPSSIIKLFNHRGGYILLFTHEWLLSDSKTIKFKIKCIIIKLLMNLVCVYYKRKGYGFAFPMEHKLK